MEVSYRICTATKDAIIDHLTHCDKQFSPPLSSRVNLELFASKIDGNAATFEAWDELRLIGLVSCYVNDSNKQRAFINHVAVSHHYTGHGVATNLVEMCLEYVRSQAFKEVHLEVFITNQPAIRLYQRLGFSIYETIQDRYSMKRVL